MKTQHYLLIFLLAFSCTMCNSSKKEDSISKEKITKTDTDKHPILSPADSLKLANHEIDVKGEVEFPLQLSVDSLKKMKVVHSMILKWCVKVVKLKKTIKFVKAYF